MRLVSSRSSFAQDALSRARKYSPVRRVNASRRLAEFDESLFLPSVVDAWDAGGTTYLLSYNAGLGLPPMQAYRAPSIFSDYGGHRRGASNYRKRPSAACGA